MLILGAFVVLFGIANCAPQWENKGKPSSFFKIQPEECTALKSGDKEGYEMGTCNATTVSCFEFAHKEAKKCVHMSKKDWGKSPAQIGCFMQKKNLLTDWFKYSCKWHLGARQCMEGADVPTDFAPEDREITVDEESAEEEEDQERKQCFEDVKKALKTCTVNSRQDPGCMNYQYCSGDVAPPASNPRLQAWFEAITYIKKQRDEKKVIMKAGMKECKNQ